MDSPALSQVRTIVPNRGLSQKSNQNGRVDPDEMAPNEPSHQDLLCHSTLFAK